MDQFLYLQKKNLEKEIRFDVWQGRIIDKYDKATARTIVEYCQANQLSELNKQKE